MVPYWDKYSIKSELTQLLLDEIAGVQVSTENLFSRVSHNSKKARISPKLVPWDKEHNICYTSSSWKSNLVQVDKENTEEWNFITIKSSVC